MINQQILAGFTGTEQYHRWSILFRKMLLSDGAKYIAENGGSNGAYWLMDAIASHQPKCLKDPMLQDIQFWTLKVNKDKSCVLECKKDSNYKPTVSQKIPYTDFDLEEIKLYVGPAGDGNYLIYLPSEY